jgi:hypothetical protein
LGSMGQSDNGGGDLHFQKENYEEFRLRKPSKFSF